MSELNEHQKNSIRLVGGGKYWGTLRIESGRLLLDCQRHGRQVQFDLLASLERGQPVIRNANSVESLHRPDAVWSADLLGEFDFAHDEYEAAQRKMIDLFATNSKTFNQS